MNAALDKVTRSGDKFEILAGACQVIADQIIYCTGFKIDTSAPAAHWAPSRRISVPFETRFKIMARFTPSFWTFRIWDPPLSSRPKRGTVFLGLGALHNFTFAATVSHGNVSGDIPCVSDGATRLAKGIASAIFNEDFAAHLADLHSHEAPEL